MYRGDGGIDGDLKSVTLDEDAVRGHVHETVLPQGHLHRIWGGLAARGAQNSENLGHGPACRFSLRPARHSFRNRIEEGNISQDVCANHSVTYGVEGDLGAFFFVEQGLLHVLALDGVAQGTKETARIDLALDEIVLDAFLQSTGGQRLVVQGRQHYQRYAGRDSSGPPY